MSGYVVGNYKIIEKIGEGGMGAVFRGIDVMLEREVAIKMLRPELAGQPHIVERFRTEAVTLARLNHPNIATLYAFLRQGNDFFMVMEFVRGETLDSVIRRTGAIDCKWAVMMFCQALEGIDYAHRSGIIHRDIKPANMMLTQEGSIKVMDFGIARVLGSARMTREGHVVGTIEYMSPEQVRGLETDARSDIYSLGILLYEILTGKVPFSSASEFDLMKAQIEEAPPPPRTFAAHIPLTVEQAIMRALAKRADARHQTAGEFRVALLSAIGVSANLSASNLAAARAPQAPISNYPVTQQASGEALKETRLASDQSNVISHTGSFAARLSPESNQIKETRLPWQGDLQPAYAQPAPPVYAQPSPQPATGGHQARASFFDKLKWQHYAAAATVAAILICVPIAVITVNNKQSSSQKNASAPPAPERVAAPAPPPPVTPSDDTVTPIDQGGSATSESAKPSRQRGSRAGRSDESPAPSQTPAQPQAVDQPQPRPQPARQPEERRATAETKPAPVREAPERRDNNGGGVVGKIKTGAEGVKEGVNKIKGIFRRKP